MAKLEIDYSLPYDEAKKKYGRNGYFMSEDQYEFNKAAAEKQAKMATAEEAGTGNWWEQKGEADKIIENRVGKENPTHEEAMAKIQETAEQRLTPEQQGILAKGNKGDNINNPNSLDTADITKLGKKELASVQTEDNMNPATYSISNDDRAQMMKDAGISPEKIENEVNTTMSDSVSDAVTPKENDTPKQAEAKGKYNNSMMSIWDAYRNGDIDKETAGYFTIDAIATLAKNLGRSIGNVGAQFSGGTIDNGHNTSMWEQRRDSMFNTELQKETEEVKTFDNILKGYQTNRAATVNDMLNDFRAKANDPSLSETEKKFYQVLAVQLAGAGLDGNAQIATIGTGVWDDIKSKFSEWFGKKDK